MHAATIQERGSIIGIYMLGAKPDQGKAGFFSAFLERRSLAHWHKPDTRIAPDIA